MQLNSGDDSAENFVDILIVGGGVVGCALARELSRWRWKILLCEKAADLCTGTSCANSAIVHSGHSTVPGSLMAKMNVRGNQLYEELCSQLQVKFSRRGSLNVAFSKEELPGLQKLMADGLANGVPGLRYLEREELLRQEPNLNPEALAGVWAPSCGIVDPMGLTYALAECAAINGVEFWRNAAVVQIARIEKDWLVTVASSAGRSVVRAKCVVNAAGVHADEINNMVSVHQIQIQGRRGEYWLLDRKVADVFRSTIFQVPGPMGKGVLISPTVDGTVLVGPTAEDVENRDCVDTTREGLAKAWREASRTWPGLARSMVITSFAGMRAHTAEHDFVLGEPKDAPGFFNAAGIESPGLTSAPAIAEFLTRKMVERLHPSQNENFQPGRPPQVSFRDLSVEERVRLARKEPAYGRIVCSCETVTEAEVREAIRRPVGARSINGVKRRVRAGMGRCQGGFCLPKVARILAEELKLPLEKICLEGPDSPLVVSVLHGRGGENR